MTLIAVILDESGSMNTKKDHVLEGFNSIINEQKVIADDSLRLSLFKFNTNVKITHNGLYGS